MNHVIAKIRGRGQIYKKVISNQTLYSLPEDLANPVAYNPDHNLDVDQWFGIDNFSQKSYCLDLLQHDFHSTDYDTLTAIDTNKMDFLCSYQNDSEYYFQRIPKAQLLGKKWIHIGDAVRFEENNKCIVIKSIADAIYLKAEDRLYFKNLPDITAIFKGIDELYREATKQETIDFLQNDFIHLDGGYSADKVKKANRQRIAMAVDTLNGFETEDKNTVLNYIMVYCPSLVFGENAFTIQSEDDLKLLLYGIEQRYFTTPVGGEKRLANSIIRIGQ